MYLTVSTVKFCQDFGQAKDLAQSRDTDFSLEQTPQFEPFPPKKRLELTAQMWGATLGSKQSLLKEVPNM